MATPAEQNLVEEKMTVIRTYLNDKFPDCGMSEVPDGNFGHSFKLADQKNHKSFKLWIDAPLLVDPNFTPDWFKTTLSKMDIARKVKEAGPEGYRWLQ